MDFFDAHRYLADVAFYHANVQFDYEALFAGVQRKATMVTTAVPDGANGHSNVVQSDRMYSIAHCSSKW